MSTAFQPYERARDLGTPAPAAETKLITLTIDGVEVTVPEGTTVIRAAAQSNINIPKLCATDNLEPLVRAFFRAEIPAKWPAAPLPKPEPVGRPSSPPRRWVLTGTLAQSRFVLAASLLALLLGGWLLAGRFDAPLDRPASFDGTTATKPPEFRLPR